MRQYLEAASLLGIAIGAMLVFHSIGEPFDGWVLDLGSVTLPRSRHAIMMGAWSVLGGAACISMYMALLKADFGFLEKWTRNLGTGNSSIVILLSLLGLLAALICRNFVLQEAPLTDDETAYLFAAETLAEGRLWMDSPNFKLFYDRAFIINDGRMFTQYFLGWPALLAPAASIGLPGLVNPLLHGFTVPAIYLTVVSMSEDRRVGLVASALYVASPFATFLAATLMSHTACLFALAWLVFLTVESLPRPIWRDALVGVAFSIAFFIRPLSALTVGSPFLILWLWRTLSHRRWRSFLAFVLPSLVFAVLFLAINAALTGSPLTTAYEEALAYSRANGFRFSLWTVDPGLVTPNLKFDGLWAVFQRLGVGVLWLNFDAFGWPSSLLLLPFAFRMRLASVWAALVLFAIGQGFVSSPGVDTFGPVHWAEIMLPLAILSAAGLANLSDTVERTFDIRATLVLVSVFGALMLVSLFGYNLIRVKNVYRLADEIRVPLDLVEATGRQKPVIFAARPYLPNCRTAPASHFVYWRPVSHPALHDDEILWVNHITVEADRQFRELEFPERPALLFSWVPPCNPVLLPLDSPAADGAPPNFIGGSSTYDDVADALTGAAPDGR